jgi:hypothetical protein
MDDLILRVAAQEDPSRPLPDVESILEHLVKNRHFEFPVDLCMEENRAIILSESYSRSVVLPLPAHSLLEIRVFNMPPDSVDREGKRPKVFESKIPIAYALKSGKKG